MSALSSLLRLFSLATHGSLSPDAAVAVTAAAPAGLTPTPIPPGCPWHDLSLYGLPNVNWCEETLCAVVNEPANAYSNLAYVLVALVMWALGRQLRSPTLRQFAPAAAFVGVASGVYHASNTYLTQIFDFLGMYVFCFLLLLFNVERLGWLGSWAARRALPLCVLAMTALTAGLAPLGFPIQSLVGVLILGIIVTETLLRRRAVYSLRGFALSVALLGAGAVCSVLDVSRRLCDPTNHVLQGHAAWHLLSALSLLAAFWHFKQFDGELTEAS